MPHFPLNMSRYSVTNQNFPRHRLLEILNSEGFEPPIIVFVNQKKGADVLAKDLNRAKVCNFSLLFLRIEDMFVDVLVYLVVFNDASFRQESRTA
jgi:superfamily II DNA/RNA helicase